MAALAYVTIDTPDRRLDVALPVASPVAEVLAMLVRHGGHDLAKRGLGHGGWSLRRTDGAALALGETLNNQGVRDGEVLNLVPADRGWPKIAYDDVAVAVQESPDRGRRWTPAVARVGGSLAGLVTAGVGCLAALRSTAGSASSGAALAGLAAIALALAALLARNGDADDPAVAIAGMPPAITAGFLLGSAGTSMPAGLAGAGVAALVYSAVAALAVGRVRAPFVAGSVIGTGAVVGAVAWAVTTLPGAAAVTAGIGAVGGGLAPAIGVRLSGLPGQRGLVAPEQSGNVLPSRERLAGAVARTDEVILGFLLGLAVVTGASANVLAVDEGWPTLALASACALALGMRVRGYAVAAHRVAGLCAAGLALLPVVVVAAWQGASSLAVPVALAAAGLITALAVTLGVSKASGSPYLARAAELLELIAIAAIVPLVCVNLGMFQPLIGS
jgi:ESX secretion system protein EccD